MILWLNPFSGLSGDMLLGALLDLGADLAAVRAAVASTGIEGWSLDAEAVERQGLIGRRACVRVDDPVRERRAAELIDIVARASPAPVAEVAVRAARTLAEVEARIHGVAPDDVHLHELGGVDTVVDTVGVAAAVHELGVTRVHSAPLALGTGVVQSAHGLLPVPAPATLALLAGAEVTGSELGGETVTPTGAVLLSALGCRYGPMPAMRLVATGYGAGARDVAGRPNVLPAVLGDPLGSAAGGVTEELVVVETNVDDVTGEVLGLLPAHLVGAGALDAWIAPVLGKKGRPAHVVSALCRLEQVAEVEARLLAETGSLGARRHAVRRDALPRATVEVAVVGHRVRVKLGPHGAKPELDDLVSASAATGLPVQALTRLALAAYDSSRGREAGGLPPDDHDYDPFGSSSAGS